MITVNHDDLIYKILSSQNIVTIPWENLIFLFRALVLLIEWKSKMLSFDIETISRREGKIASRENLHSWSDAQPGLSSP
jgi:hypothetical protein